MAHYEQNGIKKCPKCGAETENKYCPNCHSSTKGNGTWSVRFRVLDEKQGTDTHKRLRGFNSKKDAEIAYKSLIGDTEEQVIKTYSHLYSDATVDAVELMNMFIRQSA